MKTNRLLVALVTICFSATILAQQVTTVTLNTNNIKDTISRHIYGHFSEHLGRCIYDGIWVGENSPISNVRGIRTDVVEALRNIAIPNLRWPGGCFADSYHWLSGIGEPKSRKPIVNLSWGGYIENNSFGTHEFMDLCDQLNCEPVICGNIGSGTVEEMTDWIEYLTANQGTDMAELRKKNGKQEPWNIKFWGIGNETWGCGGIMTPEYYSDQLKKYGNFLRHYGGGNLYKVAVGPSDQNYTWTETIMKDWSKTDGWLKGYMNGLSLHYYTICNDWSHKGSAIRFDEKEWFQTMSKTMAIEEFISKHSEIMDKYDPENRIGLVVDEWGNWFDPEKDENPSVLYQQNTLRDALVAGINLNIFNNHCRRVKMANIAQVVNVLQSVILTRGEKMILTPTYYVFEMYKVHQDAALIPVSFESPKYEYNGNSIAAVSVSASKNKSGIVHITFSNIDPNKAQQISIDLDNVKIKSVTGKILTANEFNAHNTFENPGIIKPKEFTGTVISKNSVTISLPAKSVVMLELK
jgi:alpha-L-arabinofuranosidase